MALDHRLTFNFTYVVEMELDSFSRKFHMGQEANFLKPGLVTTRMC